MRLTQLNEEKQKLALERLQADRSDYEPFLSKESIDIHYGKLAKGYVDRFNAGEGDTDFNQAGAFLHNIYFPQLKGLLPPVSVWLSSESCSVWNEG